MSNPHPKPGPGRKKGSKDTRTLEVEALRNMYVDLAKRKGLPVAEALLKKAVKGDVQAIKEFNDRVFGRAPQQVQHTGEVVLKIDV